MRTTLPASQNEIFICKTAYSPRSRAVSCSVKWAAEKGFVPCGFVTESYEEALAHVDVDRGGNTGCWVESYEHGDKNRPMLREMHASDYGGVYVRDLRETDA